MKKNKLLVLSVASLLTFGAMAPAITSQAAAKTASTSYQKSKNKALYTYAKKMMAKNRTGLSGKTAYIFSKKAYKATGAAAGYSDLLVGLKGHGYKFTKGQKNLVAKNLVVNSKSTAADLATAIMGLKAVGLNPTNFKPAGAKKSMNLVSQLYRQSMTKQTVNVQSQSLIALSASSSFKRPANAKFTKASLSNAIVKTQQSNNGWGYSNNLATVDSDTTSMAVIGLTRGKTNSSAVTGAITKGQTYLKNTVYPSGSYGYTFQGKNTPNDNSTAEVVIAFSTNLNTLKFVNSSTKANQAASSLRAMLGYVNKTGSIKGAYSQLLGVGQVNLATAAYQQAQKKHSVYTLN